ncbi:MAG: hypothetical protein ACOC22_02135 [bacterium]
MKTKTRNTICCEKGELNFIQPLLDELGYKNIEWINKYNSYIVYDYEPFCSDGFKIRYILKDDVDYNKQKYTEFLIEKIRKTIKHLEDCLSK